MRSATGFCVFFASSVSSSRFSCAHRDAVIRIVTRHRTGTGTLVLRHIGFLPSATLGKLAAPAPPPAIPWPVSFRRRGRPRHPLAERRQRSLALGVIADPHHALFRDAVAGG